MKIQATYLGHIIIGAAIADDILSLIGLSILLGLAKTGTIEISSLLIVFGKVVAFFAITVLLGQFVVPKFTRKLHDREGKAFTFAIVSALVMAYFAELAGLHLIIGAFMAGQFVRKEMMDEKIYETISDRFYGLSYGFLVPIFFVSLSFHLHISWNVTFMAFAAVLTVMAVIGKVVGSGIGYALFRQNFQESIIVGFGMILTLDQFSALILMAFITTLMAPLTLKLSVIKACRSDEKAAFCVLWDEH
jgi:Kef-type K+ transport system membrane component KefB